MGRPSRVVYDFKASPHRVTIPYGDETIEYVFSSDLYRRKFLEKMGDKREYYTSSLAKRFGLSINADLLSDLKLYGYIEKRGYLLKIDGQSITCPKEINLTFAGVTRT